ncbi:MAG: hypothetical protein V4503_01540, partial [Gemmatimonadota bacterium]
MRTALLSLAVIGITATAVAQDPGATVPVLSGKRGGSPNMQMVAHVVTHPGAWKASDIEMEQDANRPYVYVSGFVNNDVQIYDIRDAAPTLLRLRASLLGPFLKFT